jgi:hypothetical protein
MTKSRDDLVLRALRNLGVLPQGQTADADMYQSVDDLVVPTLSELSALDVTFVPDAEQIPEEQFNSLGHVLASEARAEFGLADDTAIVALAEKAKNDLVYMNALQATYAPLKVQPF